jgi:hypothetical protein
VTPFEGALIQNADALHLVSHEGVQAVDIALPGTPLPPLVCPVSFIGSPCGECVANQDSIEHRAFAATRSPADVWVAYVVTHFGALLYQYAGFDGSDGCRLTADDGRTADLVILRVPLDGGSPEAVLTLPLEGADHSRRRRDPVSIHVYGEQLGVAVLTEPSFDSTRLRLLRMDISGFTR